MVCHETKTSLPTEIYQVQSFPDDEAYDFHDEQVYISKQAAEKRCKELQAEDDADGGIHEYVVKPIKLIA